mmetsp:Transcript_42229/g.106375  ORF Transcript_42229/g.106375 Transcript_42229/m.106375 type:complete len:119 (-) Transcript_42229:189-545(-)
MPAFSSERRKERKVSFGSVSVEPCPDSLSELLRQNSDSITLAVSCDVDHCDIGLQDGNSDEFDNVEVEISRRTTAREMRKLQHSVACCKGEEVSLLLSGSSLWQKRKQSPSLSADEGN